jgi:SM-20-related protein
LADKGWTCRKNFLPESFLKNLLNEALSLWNEGEFSKAGIGRQEAFNVRPEIRSDKIFWLDENDLSTNQKLYFNFINELKENINRNFFLSLKTFEAHFAGYPKGSFYKKHLDQFQTHRNRLISVILYLNFNWNEEYGGKLRIYLSENNYEDILPEAGTLVCFRSDLIYHEVLPCTKERFSLTGWLRRDEGLLSS